jgi:hypothetical protein
MPWAAKKREHPFFLPVQRGMKRCVFLIVLFAAVTSAFGAGFIYVDGAHWHPPQLQPWPGPFPPPRPYIFAPLEVTYHHVNVKIDGQVAVTSLDQEFYNPNPQRLEAIIGLSDPFKPGSRRRL